MGVQWTDEQVAAINARGCSAIVSAAAGAGKTAVLAARCAALLCDGENPTEVDRLLVLTFTNAAAAEMRHRIGAELQKRLDALETAATPGLSATERNEAIRRLRRHLLQLPSAPIGTIHGFCGRLLRENFRAAGIDPSARIMDELETAVLRREVAENFLRDAHQHPESAAFHALLNNQFDADDSRLLETLLEIDQVSAAALEPCRWLWKQVERVAEAADSQQFPNSQLANELCGVICEAISGELKDIRATVEILKSNPPFDRYLDRMYQLLDCLEQWDAAFDGHDLAALSEAVRTVKLPAGNLTSIKANEANEAEKRFFSTLVNRHRDNLRKGRLFNLCRFTPEEWIRGLNDILPHLRTIACLSSAFRGEYERAKAQRCALSYDDLEHLALKILCRDSDPEEPTDLAERYRRQFDHVLVDEAQDLNEVQDAILRLVGREDGNDEGPGNIFFVGDVKQCIYSFRGSRPGLFTQREGIYEIQQRYDGNRVLSLRTNFRSHRRLIEGLNGMFERLLTLKVGGVYYRDAQRLQPFEGSPDPEPDAPAIELHVLTGQNSKDQDEEQDSDAGVEGGSTSEEDVEKSEREADVIAARIRELIGHAGKPAALVWDRSLGKTRPAEYRDFAILLRAGGENAQQMASRLQEHGIPTLASLKTGLLRSNEVLLARAILELIADREQDLPMAAVLRSPLMGWEGWEDRLARIRSAYPSLSFPAAVRRFARSTEDGAEAVRGLLDRLDGWEALARTRGCPDVLWTILEETGMLLWPWGLRHGPQRIANLHKLHELSETAARAGATTVGQFIDFLKQVESSSDIGQPSLPTADLNFVPILTVHKSKGLEFPFVFVANLGRGKQQHVSAKSTIVHQEGFAFPVVNEAERICYPSLISVLVEAKALASETSEEMRVFYVAATRARQRLFLVGDAPESAIRVAQHRWDSHPGPLPTSFLRAAKTPMDFIIPTAVLQMQTPSAIAVRTHSREELASLAPDDDRSVKLPAASVRPDDADTNRLIEQITWQYPYEELTNQPAAISVSDLAEATAMADSSAGEGPQAAVPVPPGSKLVRDRLRWPNFATDGVGPAGTEIGDATHLFLQHLDLTRLWDMGSLREYLKQLRATGALTEQQISLIDLDSVTWFLDTDLAVAARHPDARLHPELVVLGSTDLPGKEAGQPLDRMLVRGRVDLVIRRPDGLIVVDYKTDRIPTTALRQRMDRYTPQVQLYSALLRRMSSLPVQAAYLVFLHIRQVVPVAISP
jgi:ATP-dependent helicase/nuclease subunit A